MLKMHNLKSVSLVRIPLIEEMFLNFKKLKETNSWFQKYVN